jgi:Fe-S cluster biosynthesis and repair protein YggX
LAKNDKKILWQITSRVKSQKWITYSRIIFNEKNTKAITNVKRPHLDKTLWGFFIYKTERKTHSSFLRGWDVSDKG